MYYTCLRELALQLLSKTVTIKTLDYMVFVQCESGFSLNYLDKVSTRCINLNYSQKTGKVC
jgi:hypothetical protein